MTKHTWFYETLKLILDEKKISINEYSKKTKISYVSLHRMLYGEQNISQKDFEKLMAVNIFSETEKEFLESSYKEFNISKDSRVRLDMVIQMMTCLNQTLNQDEMFVTHHSMDFKSSRTISSKKKIKQYIENSIYQFSSKSKDKIHMRFFINPDIDLIDGVYNALKALAGKVDKEHLDIEFLFLFDSGSKIESKLFGLQTFVSFIKLITLCDFVRISYLNQVGATEFDTVNAFPYYIVIDQQVLLLNASGDQMIVIADDNKAYIAYLKEFDKIENKRSLVKNYTTPELSDYIYNLSISDKYIESKNYTLRYSLSTMNISNEMFAERIANTLKKRALKNFALKDLDIIKKFKVRLKEEDKKIQSAPGKVTQYVYVKGIIDFLENSILSDYAEIGGHFSNLEKLYFCRESLKNINYGYDLRLIKDDVIETYDFLNLSEHFEIYYDCDEVMIARYIDHDKAQLPMDGTIRLSADSIDYAVVIDFPEITEAFKLFYEEFLYRITLSPKESFDQIKSLALSMLSYDTPKELKVYNEIKTLLFNRP